MSKKTTYTPALGYDFLTGGYDLAIKLTMPEKRFRQKLVEQIAPKKSEGILEFGFGTGQNLALVKQYCPEVNISGVDIDPKVKGIAEKKLLGLGLNIQLFLYEGKALPFGDDHFDVIYSCLVFHQLSSEQKKNSFLELFRILKPQGRLIIADWGKPSNFIMRMAFLPVQMLDGYKNTQENIENKLPDYMLQARFKKIKQTDYLNTMIGTLCYYTAQK